MKKTLLYSAFVLLLAAMACNKTDSAVAEGEAYIRFAPAAEGTRALVYQSNITGEQFKVYDFKDGEKYIDNQIKYGTAGWEYVDVQDYLWKNTNHKLFGYTAALGALPENKEISWTKVLTTSPANQVDVLYSETVNTTASDWKHTAGNTKDTPVKMNMKHLFAAVSMAVKNETGATITLASGPVPAIPNSSTAKIDYSGNAVDVSNTDPTVDASTPFVASAAVANVQLSNTDQLDILTQAVAAPQPYVIWEQTCPEMTIAIRYTKGDSDSVYETTATIPSIKWEAGKLYQYVLTIRNAGDILLNFTVKEWQDGGSETATFE